ncbi:unnamed protein product, partial [Oikopleura dioica]
VMVVRTFIVCICASCLFASRCSSSSCSGSLPRSFSEASCFSLRLVTMSFNSSSCFCIGEKSGTMVFVIIFS